MNENEDMLYKRQTRIMYMYNINKYLIVHNVNHFF